MENIIEVNLSLIHIYGSGGGGGWYGGGSTVENGGAGGGSGHIGGVTEGQMSKMCIRDSV